MITREWSDMAMTGSAVFSNDMRFRYRLSRTWDVRLPMLTFCMCNPSTANERLLDPTIRGCLQRAMLWGYGRLDIVNLCAYRATDPDDMAVIAATLTVFETKINYEHIVSAADDADMVIAAWGSHPAIRDDARAVRLMLHAARIQLHALKLNNDGSPGHPLYLPHRLDPFPMPDPTL